MRDEQNRWYGVDQDPRREGPRQSEIRHPQKVRVPKIPLQGPDDAIVPCWERFRPKAQWPFHSILNTGDPKLVRHRLAQFAYRLEKSRLHNARYQS